jgi:hypothetical protein
MLCALLSYLKSSKQIDFGVLILFVLNNLFEEENQSSLKGFAVK